MNNYVDTYYNDIEIISRNEALIFLPKAVQDYFDLSEKIKTEKDISKKLEYCNKQFLLLPYFVQSELDSPGSLPPVIACRDWAPKLYMRLGKWEDAEHSIKKSIEANAYYPNKGEKELSYLYEYKKVAKITLQFLKNNPGYLQKNIYKALEDQVSNMSILKNFIRWSLLLRKEPYNRTNKLFVNSDFPK